MSPTHHDGLAAEEAVIRAYEARGATLLERRWRSEAGEIDLILRQGKTLIFAEVKHRRFIEDAAHAIRPRQWARIAASAEAYIAQSGLAPDINMRFDAALTDRHGNLDIVENAAQFDQ